MSGPLEPLAIPTAFWDRTDVLSALDRRAIGDLFDLLRRHVGASQTRIAIALGITQPQVSAIKSGARRVTDFELMIRIADGMEMPDHARLRLGLAPRNATRQDSPTHTEHPGPVRRRTLLEMTGAALAGAAVGRLGSPPDRLSSFVSLVTGYSDADVPKVDVCPDVSSLCRAVSQAKRDYQACRYTAVFKHLPAVVKALNVVTGTDAGDEPQGAYGALAEAYHVIASVSLKHGDTGLAWLAADRSMRAAEQSGSSLALGSSARILTHALLASRHLAQAKSFARRTAAGLGCSSGTVDPRTLSVYGSLLLRGAIAAAQENDRSAALELIDEAGEAADRLGGDFNHHWTGFGPTNVLQHRVTISVALGDAGTAIEYARQVDTSKLRIAERKACLFVDVAKAYGQWGKFDRTLAALQSAESVAPEEVRSRPAVHRLVTDLVERAPRTLQSEAVRFAERIAAAS
jgi:hypothetical protein